MGIDRRTFLRLSAASTAPIVPGVAAPASAGAEEDGYGLGLYGETDYGTPFEAASSPSPSGYNVGAFGAGAYASGD